MCLTLTLSVRTWLKEYTEETQTSSFTSLGVKKVIGRSRQLFASPMKISSVLGGTKQAETKRPRMINEAQRVCRLTIPQTSSRQYFHAPHLRHCAPLYPAFKCFLRSSFRLHSCALLRSNCLLKWESFSVFSRDERRTTGTQSAVLPWGLSFSLAAKIHSQWPNGGDKRDQRTTSRYIPIHPDISQCVENGPQIILPASSGCCRLPHATYCHSSASSRLSLQSVLILGHPRYFLAFEDECNRVAA